MTAVTGEIEPLLDELRQTLREEFDALGARDTGRLIAAVERKAALVAALNAVTGKLCHDDTGRGAEWAELRAVAGQCAEINRVNGGAIELNRALVSGLLDTLHGGRRGEPTYNAAGKVTRADGSRQVASA